MSLLRANDRQQAALNTYEEASRSTISCKYFLKNTALGLDGDRVLFLMNYTALLFDRPLRKSAKQAATTRKVTAMPFPQNQRVFPSVGEPSWTASCCLL